MELGEVDVVPLGNTLLYVQPVYVESSSNQIPTLRDVVVVYNGTAYHSQNASLDGALCQIVNPDKSRPFSSYCNTPAANAQLPTASTGAGTSPTTPTQTTPSTTTPTTAPPTTAPLERNAAPGGWFHRGVAAHPGQRGVHPGPGRPEGREPGRLSDQRREGPDPGATSPAAGSQEALAPGLK